MMSVHYSMLAQQLAVVVSFLSHCQRGQQVTDKVRAIFGSWPTINFFCIIKIMLSIAQRKVIFYVVYYDTGGRVNVMQVSVTGFSLMLGLATTPWKSNPVTLCTTWLYCSAIITTSSRFIHQPCQHRLSQATTPSKNGSHHWQWMAREHPLRLISSTTPNLLGFSLPDCSSKDN